MKKSIVIAAVLSLALASSVLAQAPQVGAKPMSMSITGKIAKAEQGYIIQGQESVRSAYYDQGYGSYE